MMTGRERVRAALRFEQPDRTPRDLWASPYATLFRKTEIDELLRDYPMDIGAPQSGSGWSEDAIRSCEKVGEYVDDWGSVWRVAVPGEMGEVIEPVLAAWTNLATYRPPLRLIRERDLGRINCSCEHSDKFMISDVTARPFERLQFLRGSLNLYYDIGYGTTEFRKLLQIVHDFYLEDIRSWCSSEVDGIFFMDDWGGSRQLLINPQTWRGIFKPLYRDYCDVIHAAGKYAFFHSDGNIQAIFGDLVEVGIDAINSQLSAMDLEDLAQSYRGEVTFWGEIDRQHVLSLGSPQDVADAVRTIRSALDNGSGGVIAQCEWGKDSPKENIRAVYRTWSE